MRLSRQRRYQLAHAARGLCRLCPEQAMAGTTCCEKHLVAQRLRVRRRIGATPWHPGGVGRPPIAAQPPR